MQSPMMHLPVMLLSAIQPEQSHHFRMPSEHGGTVRIVVSGLESTVLDDGLGGAISA